MAARDESVARLARTAWERRGRGEPADPGGALARAIIAIVGPAVAADPARKVTIRSLAPPTTVRRQGDLFLAPPEPPGLDWYADLACVADSYGLVTDAEREELQAVLPPIVGDALRRVHARHLVAAGDLAGAHRIADTRQKPIDGHADIGRLLAESGDVDAFLADWPRGDRVLSRKLRDHVPLLATSHARRHGWRAALARIRQEKQLGEKYAADVLLVAGEQEGYDDLVALTDGELAPLLTPALTATILAGALTRENRRDDPRQDPRLAPLIERLAEMDVTDKETVRARDSALLTLWLVLRDAASLRRMKQVARTPAIRRELSRLP